MTKPKANEETKLCVLRAEACSVLTPAVAIQKIRRICSPFAVSGDGCTSEASESVVLSAS